MRKLSLAVLVLLLAACQSGSNSHPIPSVAQIGSDLKCAAGDHGFSDGQVGWGFCYPATWKYHEGSQASTSPPGLDLTFDIMNIPCTPASAAPGGPTPAPVCSRGAGLFAFMIISTYQRGASPSLVSWVQANLSPQPALSAISWGNSSDAYKMGDGRRIALTPNHVVILDLRCGQSLPDPRCDQGLLDLETEMGSRLDTWKFTI